MMYLVYFLGRVLDILSTVYALRKGKTESNPIQKKIMNVFGDWWWVINLALSAGLFVLLMEAPYILLGIGVVSILVALRNYLIAIDKW